MSKRKAEVRALEEKRDPTALARAEKIEVALVRVSDALLREHAALPSHAVGGCEPCQAHYAAGLLLASRTIAATEEGEVNVMDGSERKLSERMEQAGRKTPGVLRVGPSPDRVLAWAVEVRALEDECDRLREELAHLVEQAGPNSCADHSARLLELERRAALDTARLVAAEAHGREQEVRAELAEKLLGVAPCRTGRRGSNGIR